MGHHVAAVEPVAGHLFGQQQASDDDLAAQGVHLNGFLWQHGGAHVGALLAMGCAEDRDRFHAQGVGQQRWQRVQQVGLGGGLERKLADAHYEAERADTQWSQQMQEKQRQDALTQQQYDNTASERAYQDALKQQAFNNNVTTQKLNIAKGEWALKQANAQQKAAQAASKAAAAGTKSGSSSSGKDTGSSGSASGSSRSAVSAGVPYTAALLRSQGKSEVAITSALRQEGYTPAQIAKILQEMNQ